MTRNIQATDAQGNKVDEPVKINGSTPSGGSGIFEDTDGDGLYEQQTGSGIDVPETATEKLTDSISGQNWETLKSAGFKPGDVVPITTFSPGKNLKVSTTGTTFSNEINALINTVVWDEITGTTASIAVALSVELQPGTNETAYARLGNRTDGEPITGTELSSTTITDKWSGWASYTPPTTAAPIRIQFEAKTSSGTNSSAFQHATAFLGVEL